MENKNTSNGIGFGSLLQVAFIVLKLCKVIEWSWLWVLAPAWIGLGLVLIISAVILIVKIFDK